LVIGGCIRKFFFFGHHFDWLITISWEILGTPQNRRIEVLPIGLAYIVYVYESSTLGKTYEISVMLLGTLSELYGNTFGTKTKSKLD
jgi:hypothetical protein